MAVQITLHNIPYTGKQYYIIHTYADLANLTVGTSAVFATATTAATWIIIVVETLLRWWWSIWGFTFIL